MLEVTRLTVRYGPTIAADKVQISAQRGKITVLIGANGAGKSSIVNAIAGLVPADSGQIKLEDAEITKTPSAARVKLGIALVLEGRGTFTELTVRENIELGAYSRYGRASRQEIQGDIERVFEMFPRLFERQKQAAATLSGGEQQMLVIGRALMSRPKLLILDEPSLGLAPKIVDEIAATLRRLCDEAGLTIVISEQNARLGLDISDYGYVLHQGKVVLSGSKREIGDNDNLIAAYLSGGV